MRTLDIAPPVFLLTFEGLSNMQRRVIVIGGGNAGLCAAISAAGAGARVTLLERAPEKRAGGNSAFTAGAMRVAYNGVDDLRALMPDEAFDETSDFGRYPVADFLDDMARLTDHRTDAELADVLARRSLETLTWMCRHGVRFIPTYGRQSIKVDGRNVFWGGLSVEVSGGGPGLVEALTKAALREGVEIRYGSRALDLVMEHGSVVGVTVQAQGSCDTLWCEAAVLACGGFESSAEMRARYLGRAWDLAKVRGTMFNTGDGLFMGLRAGASSAGEWSGCHAVSCDLNATNFGDPKVGGDFQKNSDPFGIVVNARGRRFYDEGADFRTHTYAKSGRAVLEQPGHYAWQIFDGTAIPLLRAEYRIREVTRVRANSLPELISKMDGVDHDGLQQEINEFNLAVDRRHAFQPHTKDGRQAVGLAVPRSNWAIPLETPPFEAYPVTCGITFTYGGLRIDSSARVLDCGGDLIPGLFAAGEAAGGIFYGNYPSGSGLTSGAVFGRIAGEVAA